MNALGKGIMLASAVATLIASGSVVAQAADKAGGDKVHCTGINACKGQGSCAGAGNACKSKNACKGQGWVETTAAECAEKGGKAAEEKK
jgi:uncharacterized membrane protein